MKLKIMSYSLQIEPETKLWTANDERDVAFIEEVLGLKKDGDSIKLIRIYAND